MSRFKFACRCGKRLAAYDWMVGRLVSCPKCGTIITIPPPFKAASDFEEMVEKGHEPERRKYGLSTPEQIRRTRLIILVVVAVAIAVAATVLHILY